MDWDVVKVKPEKHLMLSVTFADGIKGKVYFKPTHLTGVFTVLKDVHFFANVFVDDGVVTWPGDLGIAPDAMHDEIKKHGQWILE